MFADTRIMKIMLKGINIDKRTIYFTCSNSQACSNKIIANRKKCKRRKLCEIGFENVSTTFEQIGMKYFLLIYDLNTKKRFNNGKMLIT